MDLNSTSGKQAKGDLSLALGLRIVATHSFERTEVAVISSNPLNRSEFPSLERKNVRRPGKGKSRDDQ